MHGVGVSVTNALSDRLEATVWRNGYEFTMAFEKGVVVEGIKKTKLKENKDKHGTKIKFLPDASYFNIPKINLNEMEKYLRSKAVLLSGKTIIYKRPNKEDLVLNYNDGIVEYLKGESGENSDWVSDFYSGEIYHQEKTAEFIKGEGCEVAIGWSRFVEKKSSSAM